MNLIWYFGSSSSNNNNFSRLNINSKVHLDGTNYNNWMRNIKIALRFEDKVYFLEKPLDEIDKSKATPDERLSTENTIMMPKKLCASW